MPVISKFGYAKALCKSLNALTMRLRTHPITANFAKQTCISEVPVYSVNLELKCHDDACARQYARLIDVLKRSRAARRRCPP